MQTTIELKHLLLILGGMCVNIEFLFFSEALHWLDNKDNFEKVKEWFDATSR